MKASLGVDLIGLPNCISFTMLVPGKGVGPVNGQVGRWKRRFRYPFSALDMQDGKSLHPPGGTPRVPQHPILIHPGKVEIIKDTQLITAISGHAAEVESNMSVVLSFLYIQSVPVRPGTYQTNIDR